MKYNLSFILILFLFLVTPLSSKGSAGQIQHDSELVVLSDSAVEAQLYVFDSLNANELFIENLKGIEMLNDLLSHSFSNIDLKYKVIYKKLDLLEMLSQHKESIEFIENLINEGYDRPELYVSLSSDYRSNIEYSKSITSSQQAILQYQKDGNLFGVADAINYLIGTYGEIGMFDEAKRYFNENLKLCNSINYIEGC